MTSDMCGRDDKTFQGRRAAQKKEKTAAVAAKPTKNAPVGKGRKRSGGEAAVSWGLKR